MHENVNGEAVLKICSVGKCQNMAHIYSGLEGLTLLQTHFLDFSFKLSGAKLSQDELNAIIAYTHRRIEQLHRQLAEQQAMEEKRIAVALEKQKEKDEEMNKEEVERELQRKSAEWAILQEKRVRRS